jgi:hypothetical protein
MASTGRLGKPASALSSTGQFVIGNALAFGRSQSNFYD